MKVVNTRFSPTTNGPIHLGHVFMAKLNEYEAHSNGGKFTVRFDDDQEYWNDQMTPEEKESVKEGIKEDLGWLGIEVDGYSSQAMSRGYAENMLMKFNHGPLGVRRDYVFRDNPEVTDSPTTEYPYTSHYTAAKVILDMRDHITILIRGKDLLSEFSLYCYFCELWGLTIPYHVYVPRLQNGVKGVSKTDGGMTIKGFREAGWEAEDLMDRLADSCLFLPKREWSYQNVKGEPVWRV